MSPSATARGRGGMLALSHFGERSRVNLRRVSTLDLIEKDLG
jgi:hypothetical protein